MNPDEYRCNHCGGVFKKGWTDEEAFAERDAARAEVEQLQAVCEAMREQVDYANAKADAREAAMRAAATKMARDRGWPTIAAAIERLPMSTGEAQADAIKAAERERCLAWLGQDMSDGDIADGMASGAPAPVTVGGGK